MKHTGSNPTVSVIGGDERQIYMISEFAKKGFNTFVYGINMESTQDNIFLCDSLDSCINHSDTVILPLPVSKDGIEVSSPLFTEKILISDIIYSVEKTNKLLLAGKIPAEMKKSLEERQIKFSDYFDNEELNIKNAVLTAEGAVAFAIFETDFSVYGSKCLITGYGRIAKALAKILSAMGAKVTVAARKKSDLVWAEINGFFSTNIKNIYSAADKFNIIFNTVPCPVIDRNVISKINKDCLVIELASQPGGIDAEKCKEENIKYKSLPGLPGKIAPKTAGSIICSTAINIIEEENMWKT